MRDVPDVSMTASPNHDGYILCTKGSCPTGNAAGIAAAVAANSIYGGTSASTPVFAGIVTLLNQYLGEYGDSRQWSEQHQSKSLPVGAEYTEPFFTTSPLATISSPARRGPRVMPENTVPTNMDTTRFEDTIKSPDWVRWTPISLFTQLSVRIATATTLGISPASPVNFGTSVTLTATVTSSPSTQTPTGTVTFSDPMKGKLGARQP